MSRKKRGETVLTVVVEPGEKPVELLTRRTYLTIKAMSIHGDFLDYFTAAEAVSSTAIEHPEWDMLEKKTWDEWENER